MIPSAPERTDHPAPGPRDAQGTGWDVVIPVKRLEQAKSRLSGLGDAVRRDLALAFLLDVLDAVRAVPVVRGIVVVTADERVAGTARDGLGDRVRIVPDAEPMELNRALHRGVAGRRPVAGAEAPGVLALCADLPALTPGAVAALLDGAPRSGAGFVADHTGAGTTAYLAGARLFDPRFGPGSRAAHAEQGATDLTASARPELRADVDTPEDLWALRGRALGVGPATRAALARHGLDGPRHDRA